MDIITIGDNVVDCYLDQNIYYPGGNAVNVAVNSKRAGATRVGYIGVFATDNKAVHIKNALGKENIEFSYSREVAGKSGQPTVNLTPSGDRVFVSSPQNTVQHSVKLRLTEEDLIYIGEFDICHTSCYSHLEEELDRIPKNIKVSFDFSENYGEEYLSKVCPNIDFAFFSGANLSDEEVNHLIKSLSQYNLEVIGITKGDKPATFIIKNEIYTQDIIDIDVVDTMGAGDSFIGQFLADYSVNGDIKKTLKNAAKAASVTCTFYGGFGHPQTLD